MHQSITVRHGNLSEASQTKLKGKVEKVSRFFDRIMSVEVVVDLKNEQTPEVEIMVSAEHKHDFVSHNKANNLWSAVDGAVQKIEQQLRKYKERVQQRHRNQPPHKEEISADGPLSEQDV